MFSSAADADADAEDEGEGDALEWRVGMRLEALDRKNPRLICVAAIAEVGPSYVTLYKKSICTGRP